MTRLLTCIVIINLNLAVKAQASLEVPVKLSQETLTIKQALDELDQQSDYIFSYSNRIPLTTKVTFPKKNGTM